MSGVSGASSPALGGPADASLDASLDASTLTSMLLAAAAGLQERADDLSELDRAIGDGDHGTTVSRAAERIRGRLSAADAPQTIEGVLHAVGSVFLDLDGGATGPLFGTFFSGMAKSAGGLSSIDARVLPSLFEGGLAAVQRLSRAIPGDKTLMDALVPAVEAVVADAQCGGTIGSQLGAAASAAEAGAVATRDLRARHGRAKHLGDRVIGHEDPGARSIAILISALASHRARTMTQEE